MKDRKIKFNRAAFNYMVATGQEMIIGPVPNNRAMGLVWARLNQEQTTTYKFKQEMVFVIDRQTGQTQTMFRVSLVGAQNDPDKKTKPLKKRGRPKSNKNKIEG